MKRDLWKRLAAVLTVLALLLCALAYAAEEVGEPAAQPEVAEVAGASDAGEQIGGGFEGEL